MPAHSLEISTIDALKAQPVSRPCIAKINIPASLLRPLWLRGQESLHHQGLIYDPIATTACWRCQAYSECQSKTLDKEQRLYASITSVFDRLITNFLKQNPDAWIINVSGGLDTRFYRLDNGRCHWVDVDSIENINIKEQLFYTNPRLKMQVGHIDETQWIAKLKIPHSSPVLILCEQVLLEYESSQVAHFLQRLGYHFPHASACVALGGNKAHTSLAAQFGCHAYAHSISSPKDWINQILPWNKQINCYTPVQPSCRRWKKWQHLCMSVPWLKYSLTPVITYFSW